MKWCILQYQLFLKRTDKYTELLSLQLMLLVLESIGNYDTTLPALDSRDGNVMFYMDVNYRKNNLLSCKNVLILRL